MSPEPIHIRIEFKLLGMQDPKHKILSHFPSFQGKNTSLVNNIDIISTWYFNVEGKTFNCCFLWTDILQQSLKSLESLWHPFVLHRGAQQLHTNSQTAICSAKKNFDSNSTSFRFCPKAKGIISTAYRKDDKVLKRGRKSRNRLSTQSIQKWENRMFPSIFSAPRGKLMGQVYWKR